MTSGRPTRARPPWRRRRPTRRTWCCWTSGCRGLNGYEVARRLRQDPQLKGVRLVAMTGYGQEADRQLAREAGFDAHLVKPVDFLKVEELLTTLLASPGARRMRSSQGARSPRIPGRGVEPRASRILPSTEQPAT